MSDTESYYSTHNAVWSESKGEWIEYENSNPPFRTKFPMWLIVGAYEIWILPILRFPAKIEAAITRKLDRMDENHQNRAR
ncbi:MAG: hypothetical protein M0R77_18415 [Gammaproteobacteria bacterium]|nr:hypothetical protein [Gammaproteobacteria bacterium]